MVLSSNNPAKSKWVGLGFALLAMHPGGKLFLLFQPHLFLVRLGIIEQSIVEQQHEGIVYIYIIWDFLVIECQHLRVDLVLISMLVVANNKVAVEVI